MSFERLYQQQVEQMFSFMQSLSSDEQSPVNMAIVSDNYWAHIKALMPLWYRQKHPWHLVTVDTDYRHTVPYLSWLADSAHYPLLPLPGWHRMDVVPYQLSVNVLFAEQLQAWKQIMGDIHCFIIDAELENYRDIVRMSVPQAYFLCRQVYLTRLQEVLSQAQLQMRVEDCHDSEWKVLYVQSRRPLSFRPATKGREIAIIGAGVAGAGVAFALAQRGWKVKVIDPERGENNPNFAYASGAVTPLLSSDDDYKARLSRAGVLRAHARWQEIATQAGIRFCGTVELNRDKGHAKDLLETVDVLDFPREWVHRITPSQATELAGIPIYQEGVFFPFGMQIPPLRLAYTLLQHPRIERLYWQVKSIKPTENHHFVVQGEQGEFLETPFVVLANAIHSLPLLEESGLTQQTLKSGKKVAALGRLQSLHALAGEVMMIPQHLVDEGPRCVIGAQGYYLPAQQGFCVMGSTYIHNELHPHLSAEGQAIIWGKIPLQMPITLSALQQSGLLKGRACVRAVVQGRLPVVGEHPVYPGLWLACAFASHGMTWSSLAGERIACALEGEPIPLEKDLLKAISLET